MIKIKDLKKVKTYEDLKKLGIGNVLCDIGSRGGNVGFYSNDVGRVFEIDTVYLPNKFGAVCNYLGGGIRGSIFASDFSDRVTGKKAKLLNELGLACIRVYENIENGNELNDEKYPDGDTNWNAKATKSARKSGIISAY